MSSENDVPDLTRDRGVSQLIEGTSTGVFALCAAVTLVTTVAIFVTLLEPALEFFAEVSPADFLTGTEWSPNPAGGELLFGVVPLVIGTLTVTITAAFIAIPIGTLTAVYLSEYATT